MRAAMTSVWASKGHRRRRSSIVQRRNEKYALLFLSPWILGFTLFIAIPMLSSLYFSFTEYNVVRPPEFIGLGNYIEALTKDRLFWPSLCRTIYYAGVVVPVSLIGSLILAILLNQKVTGTNLFRTIFFLPHLTPAVAMTLLWSWLLNSEMGLVNYLLSGVGIKGPAWLGSKEWAIPALIIMALWAGIGGNRMMIFLAGLQDVPQELYDAAHVDGAGSWQRFRNVTLPMLSPTIFFNLVLGIIGALKMFTSAYVATRGGPGYATHFFSLHIYINAFQQFYMGYASALAWLFFLLMLAFTYLQFHASRRWVYYAGGE